MKNISLILIILINISFVMSCSKTHDTTTQVEYSLIGQGNLYGNGQENISKQNLVISDSNSWDALLVKMNSVNNESDNFTENNIDFSNYEIIAIFDSVYGNGGHSVVITEIIENATDIRVYIEKKSEGAVAATVMTQPFQIVKILKTTKQIIFE